MESKTHCVCSVPFEWEVRTRSVTKRFDMMTIGVLVFHLVLGLISFAVAFCKQRSKLWDSPNVSVFLASLIFNDFISAISTVPLILLISTVDCDPNVCGCFVSLWFGSRRSGFLLSLLVALENFLPLSWPQLGARLRSAPMSVPISLAVMILCLLLVEELYVSVGIGAVACGLVSVVIASYLALPSPHSSAKWARKILNLATNTFLIVFLPAFVIECLIVNAINTGADFTNYLVAHNIILFWLNMRLLMDGLLCYYILDVPHAEEQLQRGFENPNFSPSYNTFQRH